MPGSEELNGDTQVAQAYEVKHAALLARKIPTLDFTVQNILMSAATLFISFCTLMLSIFVFLPMSVARMMIPKGSLTLMPRGDVLKRGKVVLIVGASRGIGMEMLKQYVPEPNTTVIAVSKDEGNLRNALIQLGDTPATLQMEAVDLSSSSKDITKAIDEIDAKYGPISHLYAIAGISNHLKDNTAWNMDVTEKMIQVNVTGIVAVTMAMYERMKTRNYGKICIVGSVAGIYSPANMISYASTKAFINTFSTSLRTLASAHNIDVVTVQPGFIDTRMTAKMRGQGSTVNGAEFASAEEMARQMKSAVERGGVSVVSWPVRQSVMMYGFKGLNPICDELGRFVAMKMGMAGKKVT